MKVSFWWVWGELRRVGASERPGEAGPTLDRLKLTKNLATFMQTVKDTIILSTQN